MAALLKNACLASLQRNVQTVSYRNVVAGLSFMTQYDIISMNNQGLGITQDKISLTLKITILLTNSYGMALSNGNWTEPLPCLYTDNSFLNASAPDGVG